MGSQVEALPGVATLIATFRLRGSLYGIDAAVVLEVIRVCEVTPIPHAGHAVVGVINLRGRIVTLLDTASAMGLEGHPEAGHEAVLRSAGSRILIVEDRGEYMGLLVDEVGDVAEVSGADVQALPGNVGAGQMQFCQGIYRLESRVVLMLDAAALLASVSAEGSQKIHGEKYGD